VAAIFAICLLISGSAGMLSYRLLAGDYRQAEEQNIRLQLTALRDDMRLELGSISNALSFLVDQIRDHWPISAHESRQRLAHDFLSFVRTSRMFDQVRFIDISGREVIRANFNNGKAVLVPANRLQNKANRYYYREGLKLKPGEVYVSPFDLNIENGRIEQPIKPTYRLVQGVFDSKGHRLGMAVLNVLGQPLLDLVRADSNAIPVQSLWLLNQDGYWLYSPNADDDWAFMYPGKKGDTLASREPEVWSQVRDTLQARVPANGGVYLSDTFFPARELSRAGMHPERKSERPWKLLAYYPDTMLEAGMTEQYWLIVAMSFGSAVALTVIAFGWLRLKRHAELRHLAEIRQRELAMEREKDRAMVTIAGGIAHEFNNMLAGILGAAYLLRSELSDRPEGKHQVERIERLGDRASQLVRHLLTFAKADLSRKRRLLLNDVVGAKLEALQPSLPEPVRLQVEIDETPMPILADRAKLEAMLEHLLSNAVDALADSSAPLVRVSLAPADDAPVSPGAGLRPMACLTVDDNGGGIPAESQPYVFDPFYTTKGPGTAAGMGLPMVYGVVSELHGEIKLASTIGEGTSIRIFLPLEEDGSGE